MYSKITNSVSITVRPLPLEEQTRPGEGIFAFSYKIEIENLGEETLQLLKRHWIIFSGGRLFNEVAGDGVVGMQPILEKGDKFEYTSGAVIEDPFGAMHGTYTMRSSSGKFLTVEIPQFELIHPSQLN